MGKDRTKKVSHRATPLAAQLEHDKSDEGMYKNRKRTGKLAQNDDNVDMDDNEYIESKLSKRILEQARKQIQEDEEQQLDQEESQNFQDTVSTTSKSSKKKRQELGGIRFFDDEDFEEDSDSVASETESQYLADLQTVASEDERAVQMFMNPNVPARRLLSDIIMQKIHEYENPVEEVEEKPRLSKEVLEVYSKTGEVMHTLTCKKLPKTFSILPKLKNWEEVLYVTRPDAWSPLATYHAMVTFVSSQNAQMAQRFLNIVLLPKCRDVIAETKKLPFALYRALKKALHLKPGAWFKGIFLPLCESNATLREAHVVGFILKQSMVPPLHLSVALLKLAEMEYQGAISTFMLVLLGKNHALPWKVIDGVAAHFIGFKNDDRELPVYWYRSFLMFVQRYKNSLTAGQRSVLIKVAKKHKKYQFTDEIVREIQSAVPERDTDDTKMETK